MVRRAGGASVHRDGSSVFCLLCLEDNPVTLLVRGREHTSLWGYGSTKSSAAVPDVPSAARSSKQRTADVKERPTFLVVVGSYFIIILRVVPLEERTMFTPRCGVADLRPLRS